MDKLETKKTTPSCGFEAKIAKLQAVVDKLERDPSVTLEESMKLFEDGLALTKACVEDLGAMNSRIIDLNKQLDEILLRPLAGESDE